MRTKSLIRWGGLSAFVGGVIGIIADIAHFLTVSDLPLSVGALTTEFRTIIVLTILAMIMSLFGLIAIYARQIQGLGRFGDVAFVLAIIGTVMAFGHRWASTYVVPLLAERAPELLDAITTDTTTILAGGVFLSTFLMAVGWFLFGIASLKTKVFPPISVWLVMIGALLVFILELVQFDLDKVVFYLGLSWMGWWLWSEKKS